MNFGISNEDFLVVTGGKVDRLKIYMSWHVNVNDNCILMEGKDYDYYYGMLSELLDNKDRYSTLKANSNSPSIEQFYYSRIARQVLEDLGINNK